MKKIESKFKISFFYLCLTIFTINLIGYIFGFIYISPVNQPIKIYNNIAVDNNISTNQYTKFSNFGTSQYKLSNKIIPLIPQDAPCKQIIIRSIEDGRWYNYSTSQAIIYAYSAFYDNRTTLYHDPVIRIIVLSPNDKFYSSLPFYSCRFYIPHSQKLENMIYNIIDVPMLDAKPIGMGWPLNGAVLREFIFTCVIPKEIHSIPIGVAILVENMEKNYVTSCVPIEQPIMPKFKEEVGICVQVAYGSLNTFHLVEWIEIQILLGVKFIGITNLDLDLDALTVLKYYADLGICELRQMNYIPHGNQEYMLFGSPAINDCFYRNMHRFNRILVIDFDEIILPRTKSSFKELFFELERNHGFDVPNFLFRNQYFFTDLPENKMTMNNFKFTSMKQAAPLSKFGYSAKSAVKPETCIQMHNHYCWQHTAAYSKLQLTDAIPSLAINQHYRSCHLGFANCQELFKKVQIDNTIARFSESLINSINITIKNILFNNEINPFLKWNVDNIDVK